MSNSIFTLHQWFSKWSICPTPLPTSF